MTLKETLLLLAVALGGLIALVADLILTYYVIQVGTAIYFDISPWLLILYVPIVLAIYAGIVWALIQMGNYFEDRLEEVEKRSAEV